MDSSKSELSRLYSTQWDRAKRKIDGELLTQRFFRRAIVRDHTGHASRKYDGSAPGVDVALVSKLGTH
jgi:hypothetical protein